MLLIWTFLVTNVVCHKVTESIEDISPSDNATTTLYPVTNSNETDNKLGADKDTKQKTVASWKIETAFSGSQLLKSEHSEDSNRTDSKEQPVLDKPTNESEEFRPSPHLGSFFDEDSLEVKPTRETFGSFSTVIKKPPTGFRSSMKDQIKPTLNKIPNNIFKHYQEFPYKIESAILTKAKHNWRQTSTTGTLESRPTAEVPVRVPAGGLYELPEAFKEKPSLGGDDADFGLEFNDDAKEHSIKKRVNPWRKLLHLVTALLPVGLLVSALTPSIVTIQSTGFDPHSQVPAHLLRRSDGAGDAAATDVASAAWPAPISERCRRRLLCELHSDKHYAQAGGSRPGGRERQCHRLRCEDPRALASTLRWLLTHQRPHPGPADDSGDHFT